MAGRPRSDGRALASSAYRFCDFPPVITGKIFIDGSAAVKDGPALAVLPSGSKVSSSLPGVEFNFYIRVLI